MAKYVVVDSDNNWLFFGEAKSFEDALDEAKVSDKYLAQNTNYVFKIKAEKVFQPKEQE